MNLTMLKKEGTGYLVVEQVPTGFGKESRSVPKTDPKILEPV